MTESAGSTEPSSHTYKPYEAPRLFVIGTLEALTQGSGTGGSDGLGPLGNIYGGS